jgi:hypothetical protein
MHRCNLVSCQICCRWINHQLIQGMRERAQHIPAPGMLASGLGKWVAISKRSILHAQLLSWQCPALACATSPHPWGRPHGQKQQASIVNLHGRIAGETSTMLWCRCGLSCGLWQMGYLGGTGLPGKCTQWHVALADTIWRWPLWLGFQPITNSRMGCSARNSGTREQVTMEPAHGGGPDTSTNKHWCRVLDASQHNIRSTGAPTPATKVEQRLSVRNGLRAQP